MEVASVLARLRALDGAPVGEIWDAFSREDWPALFFLIDIGAGMPRLAHHETLARMPSQSWPQLAAATDDLVRVQRLVDEPILPAGTQIVATVSTVEKAAARLAGHQCVNIDFFLDPDERVALESAVAERARVTASAWGEVPQEEAPALFSAIRAGLGSSDFEHLTGFDLARHPFLLTLSLQSLESTGIGWHRDLYWPRPWVGHDVFAVFHALDADAADLSTKGGAFVYYLPWENQIYAFYRQRHQTTVLWNAASTERRILHAVSGYHGDDTRRHLVIAQCLRCAEPGLRRAEPGLRGKEPGAAVSDQA
jgi:hypothetical protein